MRLRPAKTNFGDVFNRGIQEERGRIQGLLEEGHLVKQGWVRKQAIQSLLDRFISGGQGLNSSLVALVALEEWLGHQFSSNGGGSPPQGLLLRP